MMLSSGLAARQDLSQLKARNQRITLKKSVEARLEVRKVPLKHTRKKFDKIIETHKTSKIDPTVVSLPDQRALQYPQRGDLSAPVNQEYDITDSVDNPIYDRLVALKKVCIEEKEVCFNYWLPHPRNIDKEQFEIKVDTYVLNPEHQGDTKQKSSGADKCYLIQKHMKLTNKAEDVDRLYYWLSNELLNCKRSLYSYKTEKGSLRATYISPFISELTNEIMVFVHTWQSRYFLPEEVDFAALESENKPVSRDRSYLDGWSMLITGLVVPLNKLATKKEFVQRRYLDKKDSLILELKENPLPIEKDYLPESIDDVDNNTNWLKYLPEVDFSDNTPFVPLPESHTVYKKSNYYKAPFGLLKPGDFYGVEL